MSNNLEEAEFEEVVPENTRVPEPQGFMYNDSEMMESDEEQESSDTLDSDIAEFNKTSEQYRQSNIEEAQMFLNPSTGEMVEASQLPPLEQFKIAAKASGTSINEPKKNCKKCHGRGYTGFKLDKSPVACDCIYTEFYKSNPKAQDAQQHNYKSMNRQQLRRYNKQVMSYFKDLGKKDAEQTKLIEKSKANLGKITPVKPKDVVAETVPEVVEEVV